MTTTIKWEPIEDLKAIRDLVGQAVVSAGSAVSLLTGLGKRVPADLYESADAYGVQLDAPGLQPAEIEITVSGSRLTVKGQRGPAEAGPRYLRRERLAGTLVRTLRVPKDVDVEQIKAALSDGVLTLTMPKRKAGEG